MSQIHEITNKNRPVMRFIDKVCFCSRDLENSVNDKIWGLLFDYIEWMNYKTNEPVKNQMNTYWTTNLC